MSLAGITEPQTAGVALITAAVMSGIAVYGLSSSRNLVRQLLSIEVLFNAVLLFIIVLARIPGPSVTALAILVISIVAGEVIVIVATIAAFYRVARSLDSTDLEEEGV